MLAALTALFTALANAANAYVKWVDSRATTKKWDYEDETDELQKEIVELRNLGDANSCARADANVLRIEKLASRIKYLSDTDAKA